MGMMVACDGILKMIATIRSRAQKMIRRQIHNMGAVIIKHTQGLGIRLWNYNRISKIPCSDEH